MPHLGGALNDRVQAGLVTFGYGYSTTLTGPGNALRRGILARFWGTTRAIFRNGKWGVQAKGW